ncbi:MAG: hypothetical protein ABI651_00030 [Verrucomicrobiota bacterium]
MNFRGRKKESSKETRNEESRQGQEKVDFVLLGTHRQDSNPGPTVQDYYSGLLTTALICFRDGHSGF